MATDFKRAHSDAQRCLNRVQKPVTITGGFIAALALGLLAVSVVAGIFARYWHVYGSI